MLHYDLRSLVHTPGPRACQNPVWSVVTGHTTSDPSSAGAGTAASRKKEGTVELVGSLHAPNRDMSKYLSVTQAGTNDNGITPEPSFLGLESQPT